MHFIQRKRGSSLIVVIILTLFLSAIVAGLFKSLVFDKRLNRRISIAGEARNAAEGVAEVAMAEVYRRAAAFSTLDEVPLDGYTFPTEMRTFLTNGTIVGSSLAFKAGNLSELPKKPTKIDATDPFNAPDADKNNPVVLRHGFIYSKATVLDPSSGQSVTSYVSNLIQVREQSWLNYAVFYNLDMEMHSGETFDVVGPVHANRNAYLTAGAGKDLRFYASFTTPMKIFRKYKYAGITVDHSGDVFFTKKKDPLTSELVEMLTNEDSTRSGFRAFADLKWNSFVQDVSFPAPTFSPPGMLPYTPDDPTTTGPNELRNTAYAMVEPQLAVVGADDASTHLYRGHKGDVGEDQKFSALAGLTIRIKPPFPAAPPTADAVIAGTNPGFQLLYYEGKERVGDPVNRKNLPKRNNTTKKPVENVVDLTKIKPDQLKRLLAAVYAIKYDETGGGTNTGERTLATVDGDPVAAGVQLRSGIYDRRQGYIYPKTSGTTDNDRLEGAHHTLQIDLAKFNTFLTAADDEWKRSDDATKKWYVPDQSWTGILYVQLPLIAYSETAVEARGATDKIRPAVAPTTTDAGYAVVLRNAENLPMLASAPDLRDDGFTLATNGPVYIKGNYNADGDNGTGSSTDPDDANELSALIAADAVTLLSDSYGDDDMRDSARDLNNATFTEVATALIAGIVPTTLNSSGMGQNKQWAGGVHNFVRFLEDWGDSTYRYRGAVVCLFENEVSKGPWHQGSNLYGYWYNPPTRDVGFHQLFAEREIRAGSARAAHDSAHQRRRHLQSHLRRGATDTDQGPRLIQRRPGERAGGSHGPSPGRRRNRWRGR